MFICLILLREADQLVPDLFVFNY